MDTRNNAAGERDATNNRLEGRSSIPGDLPDSEKDKKELEQEETTINLPDVKDIPGQEFVNTPRAGSLADTTAASDDEEGRQVFDAQERDDFETGTRSDVRPAQKAALDHVDYMPTPDEDNLVRARMDSKDFQGEPLNEKGFQQDERTGDDLDVPGRKDETTTTSLGQGDEENDYYSYGSASNDNMNEGTP